MGKTLGRLALALLALLVCWQAARLVFRSDRNDDLRRADGLFATGRFHDARAAYLAISSRAPAFAPALVRLGIVATIRDERAFADQTLVAALGLPLDQAEYALVRLYQGRLAVMNGQAAQARQFWSLIDAQSPLFGPRRMLEAEQLLTDANYAGAEAAYRAAIELKLPGGWRALAHTRLALLRASSDPAAAMAELNQSAASETAHTTAPLDWAAPMLPAVDPSAQQLLAVLRAPAEQRSQALGQLYLSAQLPALAEAQFAAVAPGNPNALAAAAYAAYTRWIAGDQAEGLRRLQDLVARYPGEARPRALLALAYMNQRNDAAAKVQLEALRALAPRSADVQLAWGQWYATQHDYVAAAAAYRAALSSAPAEQRGTYALALASFANDAGFQICESGRAAAEEAAARLANDPRAWIAAAAARLSCGDAAGAQQAAERARQLSPSDAAASYYLGRALAEQGQRQDAQAALINAADLAPGSIWRERAERQLATLGP